MNVAVRRRPNKKFYLVFWDNRDENVNGWDLVYAINKTDARRVYRSEHHSPVQRVIGPGPLGDDDDFYWDDITWSEYSAAKRRGIIGLETGN